ncbi:MAG: hemolysin family protein, partial [Planctomycetota bacterium]|nr:hemolysin family protein [Planctomycetota bacterium]
IARISGAIAGWLRREHDDGSLAIEEGLRTAAVEAERKGVLAKEDRAMIEKIMEFRDVQVIEVMTPRTELFSIEVETPMLETLKIAKRTSHSRIPVYSGNRDTIVGVLYLKDLLRQLDNGKVTSVTLREIMRKPLFIPETKFVSDLLREFQASKIHMAIVVDEYGGTSGIVTIEDLIEEIVGEIQDEYDADEEVPLKRIADDTVDVDAKFHIDELNRELGLDIPEGDGFETLGGFVFSHLGKIPRVGDNFHHGAVEFTILDADERRINRLKLVIKR